MLVIGGTQQQRRGVDGAAGNDNHVPRILFRPVALHNYSAHLTTTLIRFQSLDKGVCQQSYIGVFDSLIDAEHLGVRLGINETRKAVASVAANTAALMRILLIQHDTDRYVEGLQTSTRKIVGQLLNPRLMADGRPWIWC